MAREAETEQGSVRAWKCTAAWNQPVSHIGRKYRTDRLKFAAGQIHYAELRATNRANRDDVHREAGAGGCAAIGCSMGRVVSNCPLAVQLRRRIRLCCCKRGEQAARQK